MAENDIVDNTVPPHEAVERPWASNDKLTYDNTMSHCKALMAQSERIISNAVTFDNSIHKEILDGIQATRENNRKTLSFLYDFEIPEATANAIILKAAEIITAQQKKE